VLADVGGHLGPGRSDLPLVAADPDPALAPPAEHAEPELLGAVYLSLLQPERRKRIGAFYTPTRIAEALATSALGGLPAHTRVWDPAIGGGALLLAAARILIRAGADPAAVVARQIGGLDTDATAVDVAVTALGILGGGRPERIGQGDGLAPRSERWDAVLANPPFLGQLKSLTARPREEVVARVERFGPAAAGYVDDAGLFLLAALDLVAPGGVIGFVLPASLAATRDGAATRRAVGAATDLVRLWAPARATDDFDAGVRVVCAVARRRHDLVSHDTAHEPVSDDATAGRGRAWRRGAWGAARADLLVPGGPRRTEGVVGDVAAVTADFRDEYYAVAGATCEGGDEGAPLVTCGLLDPALVRWGRRPARIGRRTWQQPRAVGLTGRAGAWASERLVPKVLVASQTRVIEAAADVTGRWLPVVPVITAVPTDVDVWSLLAALLAPSVSAHARTLHAGAALSDDAIKLSARQVAALPLPADGAAWADGAAAARAATAAGEAGDAPGWRHALATLADAMGAAYGSEDPSLRAWWWERVERLAPPDPCKRP